MASSAADIIGSTGAQARAGSLLALVAGDGSGTHPWPMALAKDDRPRPRDLSDAIHHLLMLHGRHPGMVDLVGAKADGAMAGEWLALAAAGFAEERAYLNRLAVAAGPLPSTPGHAQAEAAVLGQCHALDMLAKSDRTGCAVGAAIALVLDWAAIRGVLDAAAVRLGVPVAQSLLADATRTHAFAATLGAPPPLARAASFGAQQVLLQHRRLWDLLEARAGARAHG